MVRKLKSRKDKLRRSCLITIGGIAIVTLFIAFIAEHKFGILPCHLCQIERAVFAALAILGIISTFYYRPFLFPLVLLVALGGICLGFYHVGVELHWWKAPESCIGMGISAKSFDAFHAQFMQKPVVRCDQINWVIFGISVTIWNALLFCGIGLYSLIVKIKTC